MAASLFFSMDIEQLYRIYLQHPSIVTDTRLLKKGDLFFALKGPNFNGNQFAARALELGAAYAIVDEPQPAGSQIILVDDVLTTLQALARHHRRQFDIPFIAITGSNGKTTTKELIHAVLSSAYTVHTTQGNLNNHIGVPLTILSVKPQAQFAVIEMGANHQGEIAGYYCAAHARADHQRRISAPRRIRRARRRQKRKGRTIRFSQGQRQRWRRGHQRDSIRHVGL